MTWVLRYWFVHPELRATLQWNLLLPGWLNRITRSLDLFFRNRTQIAIDTRLNSWFSLHFAHDSRVNRCRSASVSEICLANALRLLRHIKIVTPRLRDTFFLFSQIWILLLDLVLLCRVKWYLEFRRRDSRLSLALIFHLDSWLSCGSASFIQGRLGNTFAHYIINNSLKYNDEIKSDFS